MGYHDDGDADLRRAKRRLKRQIVLLTLMLIGALVARRYVVEHLLQQAETLQADEAAARAAATVELGSPPSG